VVLIVRRWLHAQVQQTDSTRLMRDQDPVGFLGLAGAGEPVPALRVRRMDGPQFPGLQFERYVDDAVVHCVSQ
jgi:RNA-directed DNA polymerase